MEVTTGHASGADMGLFTSRLGRVRRELGSKQRKGTSSGKGTNIPGHYTCCLFDLQNVPFLWMKTLRPRRVKERTAAKGQRLDPDLDFLAPELYPLLWPIFLTGKKG